MNNELVRLLEKDKTNIIVCAASSKKALFNMTKDLDYLYDIKFRSFDNLVSDFLGSYDKKAVDELHRLYSLSFSGAEDYLNLFLITDDLKKESVKDYYTFSESNIEFYKEKNLILSLSSKYNSLINASVKRMDEYEIKPKYLSFDKAVNPNHTLKEYSNIILEVEGLAFDISKLLFEGVDINNIKVDIQDVSYENYIEEIFKFYNINYHFVRTNSLYSFEDVLTLFNYFKDNNLLINKDMIESYSKDNLIDNELKDAIVLLLQDKGNVSEEYFKYLLETTYIKEKEYKGSVEIKHFIDEYIDPNYHLFILGANQKFFPKPIKINAIFEKAIEEKELLDEAKLNQFIEGYYLTKIKSIENLYISYKLKDHEREYSKASILDRIDDLINIPTPFEYFRFSKYRDLIRYLKSLDLLEKYNSYTDDFKNLDNTFKNLSNIRKQYSSDFNLSDFELFRKLSNNKITISYTGIVDYNNCPFNYFLNRICKIEPFEMNYYVYLGNFFHLFIEKFIDKEYDEEEVEKMYSEFKEKEFESSGYLLDPSNEYFFNIFKNSLKDIHKEINNKLLGLGYVELLKEEGLNVKVKSKKGFDVKIVGKADLIIKDKSNNIAVVDYKTGDAPKVDKKTLKGLQLFIYYYLYKNTHNVDGLLGLFYGKIDKTGLSDKKIIISGKYGYDDELKTNFDSSSSFISGREVKIEKEEFDESIAESKDKIYKTIDRIENMDFKATPNKETCQSCPFGDICNVYQISEISSDEDEEMGDE